MKNQYDEEQDDVLGTVDTEMLQDQAIQNELADELNYMGDVDAPEQINITTLPPAVIQEQAPSSIPMPPVVEDDLRDAQDQRNKLQQFGMLMKAFQGFSNIPRQMINPNAKADTSLQDQVIEMANQPIGDVKTRRDIRAADQRLASSDVDLQNKMLDNDPKSDQSRSYQELMLKMIPSFDQERLSKMSARQIEAVMAPVARWQQFKDMALLRKEAAIERQQERVDRAIERKENKEKELSLQEEKLELFKKEKAKPSEAQVKIFNDFDKAETDLKDIVSMLGKNTNWVGPVDGATPNVFVGADQAAWRSMIGKFKDAYRQAITGAGASDAEVARLETRLPSEYDTYEQFKAKANAALKQLDKYRKIFAKNLTASGKNIENFVNISNTFPRQVRKGNQVATVSNEQELKEAQAEGFE